MHRTRIPGVVTLTAVCGIAMAAVAPAPAFAADVSTQDASFLRASHQGNLTEIAAGRDAQKNATTDCVRHVGRVLVRDHTALDADVRALAGKLDVSLPSSPSAEQRRVLESVRAKAGSPAYDKAWLQAQNDAHTMTLARIDREVSGGSNPEVIAAAKAARPVVEMHLDMVRGGTCHAPGTSRTVHAGFGPRGASAEDTAGRTAATALGAGGALTAAAAAWFLRARRRAATGGR
jgi:putative membrane protein